MNTLNIKGYRIEVAGKLKQIFANLKGDELLFREGVEEELLGNLQKKLGKTQKEIRRLIENV